MLLALPVQKIISYTGNPCLMIAQQLFEIMTVLNEETYNLCLKLYLLQ